MARKQKTVLEIQCDRCTRSEERVITESSGELAERAFTGMMFGMTVRFDDLCTPCLRTVKNHLEQIGKKLEGVSPDRVAKGPEEDGPPVVTKEPTVEVAKPAIRGDGLPYATKR